MRTLLYFLLFGPVLTAQNPIAFGVGSGSHFNPLRNHHSDETDLHQFDVRTYEFDAWTRFPLGAYWNLRTQVGVHVANYYFSVTENYARRDQRYWDYEVRSRTLRAEVSTMKGVFFHPRWRYYSGGGLSWSHELTRDGSVFGRNAPGFTIFAPLDPTPDPRSQFGAAVFLGLTTFVRPRLGISLEPSLRILRYHLHDYYPLTHTATQLMLGLSLRIEVVGKSVW